MWHTAPHSGWRAVLEAHGGTDVCCRGFSGWSQIRQSRVLAPRLTNCAVLPMFSDSSASSSVEPRRQRCPAGSEGPSMAPARAWHVETPSPPLVTAAVGCACHWFLPRGSHFELPSSRVVTVVVLELNSGAGSFRVQNRTSELPTETLLMEKLSAVNSNYEVLSSSI